jgi:hypothetical protein
MKTGHITKDQDQAVIAQATGRLDRHNAAQAGDGRIYAQSV